MNIWSTIGLARKWPIMCVVLIIGQLAACGSNVSGVVLDAETGVPVADATVGLWSRDFGSEDGQIVWDKDFVEMVRTDRDGRFAFDSGDGTSLSVARPGGAIERSSLCSKSPMIVRTGGPYANAVHKQLLLGQEDGSGLGGWDFGTGPVLAANADLSLATFPDMGLTELSLAAPLGMSFQTGTGTPPPPPARGYVSELKIDMMDCGWLFVRTRQSGTVAVQTGQLAAGNFSGNGTQLALTYMIL